MKKRLLSLLLVLVTVLGMFPTAALAASSEAEALGEIDIYNGGYRLSYLSINGRIREQIYTYYLFEDENGRVREIPAYCVNPNDAGVPQTVAEGESIQYLADEKASDPKVTGIIANGYPNKTLGELGLENKYHAYYATKMALWCYLLGHWDINDLKVNPNLTGVELQRAQAILAAANLIYRRGTAWTENVEPNVTCVPDRDVAYEVTVNGRKYKQQIFTFWSQTWVCDYTVEVAFTDPNSVPAGAKIVDMNNNETTTIKTEATGDGYAGQFKVLYPLDSVAGLTGGDQLSFSTNVYQYAIFYAICAEVDQYGQLQNYMVDTDPTTNMRLSTYTTYMDEPEDEEDETALRIVKYEAGTTIPLSGAMFEVIGPDGDTIGTFATNYNGEIKIPLTIVGNYTVIERYAPSSYLLSDEPAQNVTVVYEEIAEVVFENEPYGNLRIEKTSNTGMNLPGVTITIEHIETGKTYTTQTNSAGCAIFTKIQPGAYRIQEKAVPVGWQLNDTVYTTNVLPGETTTFPLVNEELPGLRIIKYDRVNMLPMPGVTFEVYRDGVSIGRYKTDEFGEILLPDAQPGTYRAFEVDTGDEGYILDTTPQEIELSTGDGIRELLFFNDMKPGMRLIKVDSADPSKVIPNAVFELKSVAGDYGPEEYTTDENGEIDLSHLPTGAYVVTEKECPGYVIDNAQRIIQLDANETAQFVFTNSIRPSMRLVKLSSDGTPLEGVTFRIAKIEDGTHYLDRTTNKNGEILISDLEPGVYSVKETATVSDHIIDLREYHVQLFPGRTSEIVLENQKRPNLTVWKYDADTGDPVPNTIFEVRAADGHSVDQIKTGADGSATLKNLLPGVYEITEKSVPSPYLLDAPSQLVTLYPNRDRAVYFENHKKPSLTVNKIDSITGAPLEGAKFQVTYASNNTGTGEINDLGTYYTDKNGQFQLTGLRDGWYKVTELESVPGYSIKEASQEVYIQSGTGKVLTFENTPLSALVVWKYDSVTGEAVEGAVFQVRYLSGISGTGGTVIGTYKTSANGSFTVTGLEAGTYIVEELASDSGHVIDTAPQTAYISGKEQDVVQLYFGNAPKGALLIKKVDSITKKPLSDVQFLVTDSTGAVVGNANGRFVTDSSGSILIEGIDPGTTLVARESMAKAGYALDDTPQTAIIQAGQTVTLEFRNQPYGSLLIRKLGEDNTPLADVEFTVTTSEGTVVGPSNGKYVTDSAGTILIDDLAPGMTLVVKESRAAAGYILDSVAQTAVIKAGETSVLEFRNSVKGNLVIHKLSSADRTPLEGVEFSITYADGRYVDDADGQLSSRGRYFTDENGQITISGIVGTVVVTEVASIDGFTMDPNSRSQTVVVNTNDTQTLWFYNDPIGGVEIIKVNEADKTQRIPNTTFEIRKVDDELVDTVTTDKNGRVFAALEDGAYYAVEIEAGEGFKLDSTPHYFEVEDGKTAQLRVTNRAFSGINIHKTNSATGEGIYGVTFLLYDSKQNPIGQYTSDQNGWVYIDDLPGAGRYYLRELENEEYVADTQLKTVYVEDGATTLIEWENTPIMAQIQIIKKSADDNPINGLPAGTLLEGAVFEIYDKAGNVVDTIRTDRNGRAVSKLLPLSRYTIRETRAPAYYSVNPTVMTAYLEHEGQIVTFEVENDSVGTGVNIKKTGYAEVMPGQPIKYTISGVGNTSTVPLSSFYWRDTLPAQVTLTKLVTGTYNQQLSYKVVYKTNLSGDTYLTLADNLSTTKNYVLEASPAALGLAANERVTEFMYVFGTVKAGFAQVETPYIHGTVIKGLSNGVSFVNVADVGGLYNGQWIMGVSRWVTTVYAKTNVTLPKTGY